VKWLRSTPAIGVCDSCLQIFKVPISTLSKTQDAEENLQEQFNRHKCKRSDASQALIHC
jgi:hypothetical protein